MAEHGSLKDRLRKTVNLTSSADRIAAFDAAEQAEAAVVAEEAELAEEEIGVGEVSFDLAPVIAKIKAQIKRLNGKDPAKEAKLEARIKALLANQGL